MIGKRIVTLVIVAGFAVLGAGTADSEDETTDEQAPAEATPVAAPPATPASSGFTSGGVHCDNPDLGSCEELSELGAQSPMARDNCAMVEGQWGQGGCPTENRIGYCDTFGGVGSRNHYYQHELMTLEAARDGCRIVNGTWHATP